MGYNLVRKIEIALRKPLDQTAKNAVINEDPETFVSLSKTIFAIARRRDLHEHLPAVYTAIAKYASDPLAARSVAHLLSNSLRKPNFGELVGIMGKSETVIAARRISDENRGNLRRCYHLISAMLMRKLTALSQQATRRKD